MGKMRIFTQVLKWILRKAVIFSIHLIFFNKIDDDTNKKKKNLFGMIYRVLFQFDCIINANFFNKMKYTLVVLILLIRNI